MMTLEHFKKIRYDNGWNLAIHLLTYCEDWHLTERTKAINEINEILDTLEEMIKNNENKK